MSTVDLAPALETRRLRLTGWSISDLSALVDVFGETTHVRFVGGARDRLDTWRLLMAYAGHWAINGYGIFKIEDRVERRLAGWCGPWHPPDFPETELSYGLAPASVGRGYMREAAAAVLSWWATRETSPLVSYIDPANTRSIAVARALGAVRDGSIELRGSPLDIYRHGARDVAPDA